MRLLIAVTSLFLFAACGANHPATPTGHVIEIDIDDHGLAGLWMARAPNLKGLIARGTLAFSRVDVPTHSNQNNMTLLTGQYPDGHNVPSNGWLSRTQGFASPVNLSGIAVGDYAVYGSNPLRTRGDTVYRAVHAAGGRSAYVGELPPFEVGADDVHLSIVGTMVDTPLGPLTLDEAGTKRLLQSALHYPAEVVDGYRYDGPPAAGESQLHFTLRDAAAVVRATDAQHPMPTFMFVWDFIALDEDPTSTFGADGPALAAIVDDYDAGLGELLAALSDKGLLDTTNILFTLDHGKVDTHNQVALGTHGATATEAADGQFGAVVTAQGATFGLTTSDYALLNEDGDALLYARVDGAGTAEGSIEQENVINKLLLLVQSGAIEGLDTTRTMTAVGSMGTRSFHDFRASSPNQADIIVFPKDDWTLNQVDKTNAAPGPFVEHTAHPYARHGGFSIDELYVPLIMAGPAFKRGVLLPHPVEHADVAPTALATLAGPSGRGPVRLATAARGPIRAALVDDPGETVSLPVPPDGARELALANAGFLGPVSAAKPAPSVVVIDVAGLYDEEVFDDPVTAAAAAPLRALAARGTRFEDFWTRSRDWPVTEYQMLTGGFPPAWVPAAEEDPAPQTVLGGGLLAMPPPAGWIANRFGYGLWRDATPFSGESLFDAARALGLTTALLGSVDFHALHVGAKAIDVVSDPGAPGLADALGALVSAHPHLFAVVALGAARTADRHARSALDELDVLAKAVAELAARAPDALVVVTSRGATTIDDPGADFYGAGTSRHVPLLLVGPGIREGIVSGQPAAPADLPATILFGLGAPSSTDFVQGTWATGAPVQGTPMPTPDRATEGHALVCGFIIAPRP